MLANDSPYCPSSTCASRGTTSITWLDSPCRPIAFAGLLAIGMLSPIAVVGALAVSGAPLPAMLVLGALVVFGPLCVIWLIVQVMWRPWSRRFPAKRIHDGAVGRSFQSVWLGPFGGFNNCIHLVIDEQHLHLIAMAPMRWCGARMISLPWEAMGDARSGFLGLTINATIDGRKFAGPPWCMRFAEQNRPQ